MYRDLNPYIDERYHRCISRFSDVNIITRGDVDLYKQRLTRLPHYKYVRGHFNCSYNNNLKNLNGCPIYVSGCFYCNYNYLTSLKGCPTYVGGDFNCNYNRLTYLKYSPTYVGGNFWCHSNIMVLPPPKNINIIGMFINVLRN
jgi:hypothetical protein